MTARGVPGLYVDADLSELAHATGVITEFMNRQTTTAYKKDVIEATHSRFARLFDNKIGRMAKAQPDNFHHVYEYSATGDGYTFIGNPAHQLWMHKIRYSAGSSANFSWQWLPAKNPNPTYRQRRQSRVGFDALRDMSLKAYRRLLKKTDGKRHTYVWRAPMLEYGLTADIKATKTALMIPIAGENDDGVIFRKYAQSRTQQPGNVQGQFTMFWTHFWGTEVQETWNEVLGNEIEKNAKVNIEAALRKGKSIRARSRSFSANVVTDYRQAFEAGQQQAVTAMKSHQRSIRGIERERGGHHNFV